MSDPSPASPASSASPAASLSERAPPRPKTLRQTFGWVGRIGLVLLLSLVGLLSLPRPLSPQESPHAQAVSEPFSAYVDRRIREARAEGVRPGNEERVVWAEGLTADAHAALAIYYIHGFGASRAEGEAVIEPLARALGATTYYTRLPGHGGDLDHHAGARSEEYFARVEEDLHRLRPLADKLLVIGSSTGGLLSAWLAARHPREVDAVVLASPLVELAIPGAFLLSRRFGLSLIKAVLGEYRDAGWGRDPEARKQPGYEDHWLVKQRMDALAIVEDVRRRALAEAPPERIESPVLLLYHYADAQHQDSVCSVGAMQQFVARARSGSPHPHSRSVAIADGNHILLSQYVRTDKAQIARALAEFAGRLGAGGGLR
jgi:pimeloyl-ACP methyl ester carboxylesterase